MNRKYLDIVSGTAVLLLAAALYIGSTGIKSLDVSRFGSGFFPSIVAGLLAILGLVIVAGGIRQARGPDQKSADKDGKPRPWAVVATFVLMAAYAAFLPTLGFLVSTGVYLFVQMLLLVPSDKRNFGLFGIISVVTAVVVYYTFVKVFQLMLPAGILG
jgi:hypothetical protein